MSGIGIGGVGRRDPERAIYGVWKRTGTHRFDGRDVPRLFSRVVGGDEGHLVKGIERKGVDGVDEGEEVSMMEVGGGEECGLGCEGEGATVVKGAVGEGGDVHAVDQAKGMVGRDEKGKGESQGE